MEGSVSIAAQRIDPQHAWGMALYSFREATKVITEMARSPDYRDMAVSDLGEISDAVLAANLMWSQLEKRKVA